MGTTLYSRGVFINRCYDELNLSQPELVRTVHEEYLQAGAEIIETNTFGANHFRLLRHGLQDKVLEINRAGARIARQAVDQLADKQAGVAYVAGAIGPLGLRLEPVGKTSLEEARAAFSDQIKGLLAGGVDLLIIETMPALNEAEQALRAAKETAPDLPVLVMVTVDEEANCLDGASPETAAARLTAWGADAIGCNCSVGPATILTADRADGGSHEPAADCHAECRHAASHRGTEHLPLFAGVHGELRAEVSEGGGPVRRGLLRYHAEPHSGDEVGFARHRGADGGSAIPEFARADRDGYSTGADGGAFQAGQAGR